MSILSNNHLDEKYNTTFIEEQISQEQNLHSRFKLLAGIDSDAEDVGAIICSCFQIGENSIKAAIESGDCKSVEALGQFERRECDRNRRPPS